MLFVNEFNAPFTFARLLKKKARHDMQLMICMALKAISLSDKLFVLLFISFVVSVKYFFAAAPAGSMNKIFFQKINTFIYIMDSLDTSSRFFSPHLMFVYSLVTISVVLCSCCDSVAF